MHRILTLSDRAEVQYKTCNFYSQRVKDLFDGTILYRIKWPLDKLNDINPYIITKDLNAPFLKESIKFDFFKIHESSNYWF